MTDEFYACNSCGEYEGDRDKEFKLMGFEGWHSQEQLTELEEELKGTIQIIDERDICAICQGNDFSMVSSTED